jgi:glycosyltransferase involved in cell wall biosynthesis
LRLGFLVSGSLDALTGGYIYDRRLVDYLRQKGQHIDIIHLPGHDYPSRLLQSTHLSLTGELKNLPLDVLLEDELDHPSLIFLNRKLKNQLNCPIISIVHNLHCCELRAKWQNQLYRMVEKYYLLSVDGFIFNSHTTRRAVENLIGTPGMQVIANPCGDRLQASITESEIIDRAQGPEPLRILFLGNLFRNKGLHILLEALAELPINSYHLTVIGDLTMDRSYVKAIKSQIQKYNLDDKVSLLGPLNNNELAARLKESHVLVVPSFYEGFGMAYLEGMGFGLPAIGTTAGAVSEIIHHGESGFLVPPGDSGTLSRYLQELIRNRQLLAAISLNAYRYFKSRPNWQITCDRILNFLQVVANKH